MTTPDKNGWITHDGGPNPVPGAIVDMRFGDGAVFCGQQSDRWNWSNVPSDVDDSKIAAYRLPQSAQTPPPVPAPNAITDALSAVLYRRVERVASPGRFCVSRNELDVLTVEFFSDDAAADFLESVK
jgi:hypothetical protein